MDFLSSQGFNAIRFPFNHKSMLSDEPIELTGTVKAKSLRGLTYPQMFRSLAQHVPVQDPAGDHHLLHVFLSFGHLLRPSLVSEGP